MSGFTWLKHAVESSEFEPLVIEVLSVKPVDAFKSSMKRADASVECIWMSVKGMSCV